MEEKSESEPLLPRFLFQVLRLGREQSQTDLAGGPELRGHKRRAAAALQEMGLTISDAIRLLLLRVAEEKRLPFEVTTRIFDRRGLPTPSETPLPTAEVALAAIAVTVLAGAITWWRVARATVTR